MCCHNPGELDMMSPHLKSDKSIKSLKIQTNEEEKLVRELCYWESDEKENIVFASFLDDINPNLIIAVTSNLEDDSSKFIILRLKKDQISNE